MSKHHHGHIHEHFPNKKLFHAMETADKFFRHMGVQTNGSHSHSHTSTHHHRPHHSTTVHTTGEVSRTNFTHKLHTKKVLKRNEFLRGQLQYLHDQQSALISQSTGGLQYVDTPFVVADSVILNTIMDKYLLQPEPAPVDGSHVEPTWAYYLKNVSGFWEFKNETNLVIFLDIYNVLPKKAILDGETDTPSKAFAWGLREQTVNGTTGGLIGTNYHLAIGQNPGTVPKYNESYRTSHLNRIELAPKAVHRHSFYLGINRKITSDYIGQYHAFRDITYWPMIIAHGSPSIVNPTSGAHSACPGALSIAATGALKYEFYNIGVNADRKLDSHTDTYFSQPPISQLHNVGDNTTQDVTEVMDV